MYYNSRIPYVIALLILSCVFPQSAEASDRKSEKAFLVPAPFRKSVQQILVQRKTFSDEGGRMDYFLSERKDSPLLEIRNLTEKTISLRAPSVFPNWKTLNHELGISDTDSDQIKSEKIFNFVHKDWNHFAPLYESHRLHSPLHFRTVYGAGICDDAAHHVAFLARLNGLRSSTWWIGGHVMGLIHHDGAWRVYDADALGVFIQDGLTASVDDWISFAREGRLVRNKGSEGGEIEYNTKVLSEDDNRFKSFDYINRVGTAEPFLEVLPGERIQFTDTPYFLTTDGIFLQQNGSSVENFYNDYAFMGNIIREIPVTSIESLQSKSAIRTYFPISAAFFKLSKKPSAALMNELPSSLVESEFLQNPRWINGIPAFHDKSGVHYLDLILGIRNLDIEPSHTLYLNGLDQLKAEDPGAKLVLIQYFIPDSLILNEDSMKQLTSAGLQAS